MSAYPRYPRPAELAALGPGHNVVESSAGTGKTYLLERLFIDLILKREVPADQILIVTFTEKAAAELVLRVRRLLEDLVALRPDDPEAAAARNEPEDRAWTIDEPARACLQNVLLGFDRLCISTIHGFCQRLLREHAFVQGRLFDEELIGAGTAFAAALRDVLRTDMAKDDKLRSAVTSWLSTGRSIEALEDLLLTCNSQENAHLRRRFDEARLLRALAAWQPVATEDEQLKQRLKSAQVHQSSVKSMLARLRRVSEIVEANRADALAFLAAMQVFPNEPKMADGLAYVLEKLEGKTGDPRIAALAACVRELDACVVPLDTVLVEMLLPRARAQAAARKRQAGQFDYSDLIQLVASALDEPTPTGRALLATLRRRYQHALIDEFQDTDDLQWPIFRRIFVEANDHHSLTVIGDPKQAIYSFRGANVHTYLQACQDLERAGGKRLVLDRNFRGSPKMVAAINLLFDQSAGFFRREGGITYDHPVTCGREDLDLVDASGRPQAPVAVLAPESEADVLRTRDVSAAIRAGIVDELRRLLDEKSPWRLRDKRDEYGERPLHPRDIFILTFTKRESQDMGRALVQASIPFAFYKLDNLFESPEAASILDLLRAIAAPDDPNLRVHALFTEFFALDLVGAAAVADLGADAWPARLLYDFAALADTGDIPRLFSAIIERTGVVRREIFASSSERSLTNILHVFELLQTEWARSHSSLAELVDLLDAFIRGTRKVPTREGDLQRLETDKNAVQILTVHKAKGLEANVVFVYGGTGEPPTQPVHVLLDGERRVLHIGRLDREAKQAAKMQEADERSRLLYVACTRARVRLVLPHYPPEFKTLGGPYLQANQRLDALLDKPNPLFQSFAIPRSNVFAESTAVARPASDPQRLAALASLASPAPPADLAAIKERRGGFLVTSYTAVKHAHGGFVPLESHGPSPVAPEVNQDPDSASDGLPGGKETGIFLHEALATLSLPDLILAPVFEDWFALPRVRGLLERLRQRHNRSEGELPIAARLIHTAYTAPVQMRHRRIAGLARVAPALREMEFLFPIPETAHPLLSRPGQDASAPAWKVERGVVKGFVDLLFEDEGKVFVCDWKSDALPSFGADGMARHCQQNYDVQARIYTLAALRMCQIRDADDYARRFGGVLFCFLRGRRIDDDRIGIHIDEPSWDDLLAWESDMLGPTFWGIAR
jgi:exodeoxyribonuclease V beta subunit